MSSDAAELLVVGAGPAGLSTALAARALGVDVTVLEAEPPDRIRPGSRALYVHHETLSRLEGMSPGLGGKIGAFGIRWQAVRTIYRGREVYARRYPASDAVGLPPYASLRQVDTEQFLLDACRDAGVRFVWGARAANIAATEGGVSVTTADNRSWSASYLVGADGARSAVRAALGIAMDGGRSEEYRVAVDLAYDETTRDGAERLMHYRHPAMSGQNLLVVPFTGGSQVDVQCASPAVSQELSDPAAVRQWLPEVAGPGSAERIHWITRYPCLQRVADSFIDASRRVLLVGEAAHLFVPLGARGMNSGIADADAAATAVGVALRSAGEARRTTSIERFDHARRYAAERNRARVAAAMRHLRASTRVSRTRQALAARLAPVAPSCGAWLDKAPFGPRGMIEVPIGHY